MNTPPPSPAPHRPTASRGRWRRLLATLAVLPFGLLASATAQESAGLFASYALLATHPPTSAAPGSLLLDLDGVGFFRNAETATPYTQGYSALAVRLQPTLRYHLGRQAVVRAGVELEGYAGSDSLHRVRPVVALEYAPTPWLRLVVGELYGCLSHRLEAPLYDPERYFAPNRAYREEGLQLLTSTHHYDGDTWLSWDHLMLPWTADQERFTVGSRHHLSGAWGDWQWTLPVAAVVSHVGGEYSVLDSCVESLANESFGIELARSFSSAHLRHTVGASLLGFLFQNISPADHRFYSTSAYHTPSTEGEALYARLRWQATAGTTHRLTAQVGLWASEGYLASRGSYAFQSVSWRDASPHADKQLPPGAPPWAQTDTALYTPSRRLLTFGLQYEHHFDAVTLGLSVEAYTDLHLHRTDLYLGLVLRMRHSLRLLQLPSSAD
ncbi:MAG: hypothetical protein IJ684_06320 [Bacteroidales bacterium]|nr:hypothetical protein [Bacteroidales bacterium]